MNIGTTQRDYELNIMDEELQGKFNFSEDLRLGYIRKVYGILSAQLLLTVIMSLITMSSTKIQEFQRNSPGLLILFLVLACVLPYVIVCFESTMRQVPYNYAILFAFTFAESYIVSFICAISNAKLVFMAAAMTFCLVAALTLYALTTKTDFTVQGGMLFVFACAFMMLSLFCMFSNNRFLHIVLCVLAIILYGWYLLYDTQLIIGNKENSLDTEDYILGAFILYTDMIAMFLRILTLLQLINESSD